VKNQEKDRRIAGGAQRKRRVEDLIPTSTQRKNILITERSKGRPNEVEKKRVAEILLTRGILLNYRIKNDEGGGIEIGKK